VVVSARRADRLDELDAHTVVGDVTRDDDCRRIVEEAVEHSGGLDAIVYTVGASPLLPLVDATSADWQAVFATNVIGAAQVVAAAAPHLLATDGRAVVLSSKAAADPFPHLSLYGTSKVALDGLLRCLPKEFPGLRVTRVIVGNTAGTEFADGWDADRLTESIRHWAEIGVLGTGGLMTVDQVAESVIFALTSAAHLTDLAVMDHETDVP